MKKNNFILPVLLFISSCIFGQDGNNALLWRISSKQADKPSYLYGTMHLAQKQYMTFSDSVYKAVAETEIFFGELDYHNIMDGFGDGNTVAFFEKKLAFLDSASKTPEWKAMVMRMNRKYGTSINPDSLEQFAAFGSKITTDMYEPEPGLGLMDVMLSDYAQSLGKKTGGLETFMLQVDMLYSIIAARLQDSTLNFDDEKMIMANFKRYYSSQRLDSINAYLQSTNPNYRNIIFTRRNTTMADSIEKHSNNGPAFFAIGCGHLPGDDGVIALLRKKGFVVTPVHSDNKISLLLLNELKDKWEKTRDKGEAAAAEAPVQDAPRKKGSKQSNKTGVKIVDAEIKEIKNGDIPPPPPPLPSPKRKAQRKNVKTAPAKTHH
jgi:uncharacterized protein YbaP (TraB family)